METTNKTLKLNALNEQQQLIDAHITRAYWTFCDYIVETASEMRTSLSQQYYEEHHEELDALMQELLETRNRLAENLYNVKSLSHVLRFNNTKLNNGFKEK